MPGAKDSIKATVDMQCRLNAQIMWLCDRLSEARILVGHDKCSSCAKFSFEACRQCWFDASLKAVEESKHV